MGWASAIRVLGHFKSARNIELLVKLLSDPLSSIVTDEGGKRRRKVYGIRRESARVLKEWGVDFKEPVLEEPVRD